MCTPICRRWQHCSNGTSAKCIHCAGEFHWDWMGVGGTRMVVAGGIRQLILRWLEMLLKAVAAVLA